MQAKGLVHQLLNYQFIAHLCLFCRILSETYVVSTTLQSSTIDISQSVKLITSMISSISDLREKQSGCTDEVVATCSTHDVPIEGPRSQEGKRKRTIREPSDYVYTSTVGQREVVTSETIRVQFFIPVLDRILSELRRRFSDDSLAIVSSVSSVLCPDSPKFLNFGDIIPLLSVYSDACDIDKTLLKAEMTVALNLLKNELKDNLKTTNLETVLSKLTPQVAFPNLMKCVQLALTLPVTSASCERSFSAMKIIKTDLRNKTGDDRLSDLAVLFINKDRHVDREQLINTFAERLDRRIQFS